jgi:carbohydrate kinase (thermoresistant glucokinase family)
LKEKTPLVYVVMGVAGCGKTTVGQALARHLGCPFYDGDDFHSPANVAKMASGIPLDDADREPWLASLAELIRDHLGKGESAVVACSALKRRYRDQLRVNQRVRFIFLDGDFDLIWQRMQARQDHYMKPEMLRSQFEALELPEGEEAIRIPIDRSLDEVLALVLGAI